MSFYGHLKHRPVSADHAHFYATAAGNLFAELAQALRQAPRSDPTQTLRACLFACLVAIGSEEVTAAAAEKLFQVGVDLHGKKRNLSPERTQP